MGPNASFVINNRADDKSGSQVISTPDQSSGILHNSYFNVDMEEFSQNGCIEVLTTSTTQ